MILLDSNIVIYASKEEYSFLNNFLINEDLAVSLITKIEELGYYAIPQIEKIILIELFKTLHVFAIDDACANMAVQIRETYKLSLGDAIIAATALTQKLTLVTRNTNDFKKIKNLKLLNPF